MTSLTFPSRNQLDYIGLVAVILIVITAQMGAFYRLQNLFSAASAQSYLTVNTLINYGNGTSKWHNRTDVPSGWTFYQLTTTIAKTDAPHSTSVSSQHLVIGLDGVRSYGAYFWSIWIFCQRGNAWTDAPVGADLIRMKDGDILAWFFQVNDATWDPPVEGATKVARCTP